MCEEAGLLWMVSSLRNARHRWSLFLQWVAFLVKQFSEEYVTFWCIVSQTGLPDWAINRKMGDLKNYFVTKKRSLRLVTNWAVWSRTILNIIYSLWSPCSGLFLLNKNSSYYMVPMLFLLKSLFLRNSYQLQILR